MLLDMHAIDLILRNWNISYSLYYRLSYGWSHDVNLGPLNNQNLSAFNT